MTLKKNIINLIKKSMKALREYIYTYNFKRKNYLLNKCNKSIGGITLIGLVVTIIIILVIAGVSISIVAGDNGLLARANNASQKNKEARIQEDISLAWTSLTSEYYGAFVSNNSILKNNYFNAEKMNQYLGNKGSVDEFIYLENDTNELIYTDKNNEKYIISIDESGNVSINKYVANEDKVEQYINIVFDADGGNFENPDDRTRTIKVGETIGDLPVVTKENCVFLGWYSELISNSILNREIVYKAKWRGPLIFDVLEIGDYVDVGIDYNNKQVFSTSTNIDANNALDGWRVLSKESDGKIKLISAGCPLTYKSWER